MNELFEKNLAHLRDRYPELAAALRDHRPSPSFELVPTSSDLYDLSVRKGDETLSYYGVPNPLEDALGVYQQKRFRNPALMVFLGLGLGYRVAAYLSRPNPNTQAYLLVEKEIDVFYHLLHVLDVGPLVTNRRVHLLVGLPEERFLPALRAALNEDAIFCLIRGTSIESDSAGYRLDPGYYKSFLVALRDASAHLLSAVGNAPHDSFVGIRHMLLNLETIAREPALGDLFGKFHDRPAFIVATGPSLDKNYHLLPEIQDRALIFSVDASLKFLLGKGIRPHFVTSLERVPETLPFFQDIDPDLCRETVQVAVPVVVPEVYAAYPGPKAIMYRSLAHFAWLEHDKGTLQTGHSSANMAFRIAVALGCNPIILVGQDLAYADDGDTHASAAYWGKRLGELDPQRVRAFRVRGNLHEWVLTNEWWNLFREHYVAEVAQYPGTVINATEGGAFIAGTSVMSLREAIDRHVGAPFAPAEEVLGRLRRPAPEEAEAFLARIREHRTAETLACLDAAAERFRKASQQAREEGEGGLDEALRRAYEFLHLEMAWDPLFSQAASQVLQPTYIQTMLEYYDLPNRFPGVEQINAERLRLLARCFQTMASMLDRTRQLYADPLNTLA